MFVALQRIKVGEHWLEPGDEVPVEEGRDYGVMQRLGQIAEVPGGSKAAKAAGKPAAKADQPKPAAKAAKARKPAKARSRSRSRRSSAKAKAASASSSHETAGAVGSEPKTAVPSSSSVSSDSGPS